MALAMIPQSISSLIAIAYDDVSTCGNCSLCRVLTIQLFGVGLGPRGKAETGEPCEEVGGLWEDIGVWEDVGGLCEDVGGA